MYRFKRKKSRRYWFSVVIVIAVLFYIAITKRDEIPNTCSNLHTVKDSKLPKILHIQMKKVTPYKTKLNVKVMIWTDELCTKLIKEEFAWFLPYYNGYAHNIQRIDAARYFILYKYGGLYMDADYEAIEDFWNYLPDDQPTVVESPYKWNEDVQNSLMSSPVNNSFWNTTFELLVERSKSRNIFWSTGPSMLDEAVRHTRAMNRKVQVLPCENYHRIPFGEWNYSPFIITFAREFMGRVYNGKYCGYKEPCEMARHHNTVKYLYETLF